MQLKHLTAAIALALLMFLGSCGTDSVGTADPNPGDASASYKSALEQSGVHDGTVDNASQNSDTWDSNHQFTQDKQINTRGKESMGDDLRDAGKKAKNGIENATRDIKNGAKDTAIDTKNAVENMR